MRSSTYLLAAALGLGACASAEVAGDGGVAIDAPGATIDGTPGAPDAELFDATPADAMLFDAALEARSFTDDSAAEFTSGGGTLLDTTVESWGAVAPIAWYTGGLLERASDTGFFTDGTTATWAEVQTFPLTGKSAISWQSAVNWITDTPPSVGLTNGEDWTQWYEGEIFLEAGTWTFSMLVDDHGFVEIAQPGSTTFARLASANWATEASGPFTAATAAWYPFRYAIAEQTVDAQVQLRFTGPGVGLQPIPRHRFRSRVDQLTGMVQAGFDDSRGVGDVDTTIDTVGPGNTGWGAGNPGDLGMTAAETFSVRWTGQLRVDVGGNFNFRYVTDDGQRLWVDGVKVIDVWGDTTANTLTAPIILAPGWHDLVIDQTEHLGGASATLTVETGPELIGQVLPVARLRPVEGRAERISPAVNHTDVVIPTTGTITTTAVAEAPVGALITSVDVNYEFAHSYYEDLLITLQAPSGAQVVLRNHAGGGTHFTQVTSAERFTTTGLNGGPAGGTWTLIVEDTVSGDGGTLYDFAVTPHWSGGAAPIPTTATYESTVRDLGDGVTGIDTVTWTERLPAGADIAVRVRTGATSAECATATYSAPLTASGGAPAIGAGRYLQYQVTFTSDGDRAPALESLRVDYQVAL